MYYNKIFSRASESDQTSITHNPFPPPLKLFTLAEHHAAHRQRHTHTFVEQHHNLLEGLHEVDVVVAVLLDLQEQCEFRQALCRERFQQRAVLLQHTHITRRYRNDNA